MCPELYGTLSRAREAEFPGIPSTQEWRDDFPATQIPPRKSRTAYLTPQTSFTAPSNETDIDGFDIQALVGAPQTPAGGLKKSHQMPPTPMSIKKRGSSREIGPGSAKKLTVRVKHELDATSILDAEVLPASPTHRLNKIIKCEGPKVPRRRMRGHKKRKHSPQTDSDRSVCASSNSFLTAPRSPTPEPWPIPFPRADRGIYPYLPPAKQFDQMVKFTSATEEHIDKWDLHGGTYPVPLLRQVLSAQECVHMGLYSQLEHMDKLLGELEQMMKPVPAKERARSGKVGDKYKRITPPMLEKIKFMRSITKQHQVCFYESRIPTRPTEEFRIRAVNLSPAV